MGLLDNDHSRSDARYAVLIAVVFRGCFVNRGISRNKRFGMLLSQKKLLQSC